MRIVVRFRRARTRLSRYLGISVGAHGLVLLAVVVLPYLRPKADLIPMDAGFVELVGPIAPPASGSVSTATPPRPPEPRPAPEPDGAHAIEKLPDPVKKKEPAPKPKEIKKKEDAPEPPSSEPAVPGASGQSAPGPPGPPTSAPGAAGITTLESGDPGMSWYNAAIGAALENAWTKPVLDGVGGTQSVIVTFEIARDGNVLNLAIDVPSGIASLDRSALRAVQDAAPFPPPPPTAGASVRQRVRFDLRPGTD